jgi:ABC-2 type transport system permease protein
MSAFGAAFRDTLRRIAADEAAISAMVGAVVLYSFFYPAPYTRQVVARLPVVVVDLDRSPMSRNLVRSALGVRGLDVVESQPSITAARTSIESGRAQGAMVIQSGFQRDILRGGRGEVALLANGALLAHGSAALSGFGEAVTAFGQDAAIAQARFAGVPAAPPIRLVRRPLFNTREGYGSTIVPAVAVLIIQQTLMLGIGLLLGTLQSNAGRISLRGSSLLGVGVALCTVGAATLLYFAGFAFWFQDYPRGGNVPGLLVTAALFISAVVALGLLAGSFFYTRERALPVIALVSLPIFFLANVSWPKSSSPLVLTWLAKLLPTTPGITAMVKFNQMGAGFAEASGQLTNLAVLVLLYGGLTAWRYRPRGNVA